MNIDNPKRRLISDIVQRHMLPVNIAGKSPKSTGLENQTWPLRRKRLILTEYFMFLGHSFRQVSGINASDDVYKRLELLSHDEHDHFNDEIHKVLVNPKHDADLQNRLSEEVDHRV
jgi:hypothetical protein